MAFWRPGEAKPEITSLEVDRDVDESAQGATAAIYNPHEDLAVEEQRRRLPAYSYRRQILWLVETKATTVIVGQTGSGKSTQVPQFLAEAGWAEKGRCILCSQPRRIAAQKLSTRVAQERGVQLGGEVGYAVRLEDVSQSGPFVGKQPFMKGRDGG